ncbi:MAG: hypothetical protein GON13_03210 [Nanoarchaeota archaeon]|nr:hypothetical protein [Nanoarchaeota archaeon]
MKHYVRKVKKAFERPDVRVNDSHAFWLKKNDSDVVKICHSIKDLKAGLKAHPETLSFHKKDDFANWVEGVFNNKTLARKIRFAPKKKIIRLL